MQAPLHGATHLKDSESASPDEPNLIRGAET